MGAWLAGHLKELLDCLQLTGGHLLGIKTDNVSTNYLIYHELQTTLKASRIEWPALRNYIPCMAYIIELAVGAFMSSLRVVGHTKSWDANECDQQFGENESTDIGKTQ